MEETESFDTRVEAFSESVDELLLFHELREVKLRETFECAQP